MATPHCSECGDLIPHRRFYRQPYGNLPLTCSPKCERRRKTRKQRERRQALKSSPHESPQDALERVLRHP